VLAVLASFAKVYAYSMPPLDGQTDRIHTSVDGWGRVRVSPVLADTGFSSSSFSAGPRYGLLLCLAAAAMVLGWLVQLRAANQPRLAPLGSPLSGLGSVFLCGVVACLLVDVWPVVGTPGSLVRLGPCLYLAAGSALVGVATWIVQQRGQRGSALAPALAPENGA
jgi:drug/metabolite transporter (DMT)-like permease